MERIRVARGRHEPVIVRVSCLRGCWLASADTEHGPSIGLSRDRLAAIYLALDPFQPAIDVALDGLTDALIAEVLWQ